MKITNILISEQNIVTKRIKKENNFIYNKLKIESIK